MSARFEDELARSGELIYTVVGTSMLPMLRQKRDVVVIRKPEGRLRKYDVALYRRDSGRYVLHRVLRVGKDGYTICGDNQRRPERGVTDRQIIGVLSSFVRDGKEIPVTDRGCRLYARIWCGLFPLRAAVLRCVSALGRLKRKRRCARADGG